MSVQAVRRWREALEGHPPVAPDVPLSPAGLALVLGDALAALHDDALHAAVAGAGRPYDRALVIGARTVPTASIEWVALLLAHGTQVTLKTPHGAPGLGPWLAHHAAAHGLPLTHTDDHGAVADAELVVAMGQDASIAAIRQAAAPGARVLGFGTRWSVAWIPAHAPEAVLAGLARDLAAFDGRGCMTPALVATDHPEALALRLAPHLTAAEVRWPRGRVSDEEGAALRARAAVVRAVGVRVAGAGWEMHAVTREDAVTYALPRVAQLVGFPSEGEAAAWVHHVGPPLSTVGRSAGSADPWPADARKAEPGTMQRPPVPRVHDGLDQRTVLTR